MSAVDLACFVSSHGFGHAARTCAVINALFASQPRLRVAIVSETPAWFFEQSLDGPYAYQQAETDIGLVQRNALREDVDATAQRLGSWLPFTERYLASAVGLLKRWTPRAVLCDVSPVGLVAAQRAGIPAVLVENFTWDWIYRGYQAPALEPFAAILEPIFASASQRIQTTPFCQRQAGASTVAPVARQPRRRRGETRRALGIAESADLVMVTMGGIEWDYGQLATRIAQVIEASRRDVYLLIAGGAAELQRRGRVIRLPHRSDFYHPDLIAASDAVIGKLGYSTLAEVAQAGVRFGYVPRPQFPESEKLEAWTSKHLSSSRIDPEDMESGAWLACLEPLLALPVRSPLPSGAEQVAEQVLPLLSTST